MHETRRGSGRRHHAAAKRREASEALLYIYARQAAESQRTGQVFFGSAYVFCIAYHRECGRYTLVAAAGVGHHRHLGAPHAGVACRRRHRQDVTYRSVAEEAESLHTYHLAQTVAVILAQRETRRVTVHPSGLEYEPYLLQRRSHGELIDRGLGQSDVVAVVLGVGLRPFVEKRLAIFRQIYEVGVRARDHGLGHVAAALGLDLDMQVGGGILMMCDRDAVLGDVGLALFESLGSDVAKHFETILRTPRYRAEGHGDRQADHARARNADAHSVLDDVAAQAERDLLGQTAQQFRRPCHTERHRGRFGAAYGRHHLAVYKIYDSVDFG